jgi:glycosyltransferase involved in cell wall biosynthesis
MEPLSAYILTRDSEEDLGKILGRLEPVVDEILVLDSGSTDRTREIAESFPKVRWQHRALDDFSSQRNYALDQCAARHVFFIDSDEFPDDELIQGLQRLRREGFSVEAYDVQRDWFVLSGKRIHSLYPVSAPDFPVRLIDKAKVRYNASSNMVHETLSGYETCKRLPGRLRHHTFRTREEIARKLKLYSDLAAQDLIAHRKSLHWVHQVFNPYLAFIKWYFGKGGFKEGRTGLIFAAYAFNYTREKYRKAARLVKGEAL